MTSTKEQNINTGSDTIEAISQLLQQYSSGYYEFVFRNSHQFAQNILNTIISRLFNVPLNDSCNFLKLDNRPIYYYELRILMLVRATNFNLKDFIQKTEEIIKEYHNNKNKERVDLSLLEVLPTFKLYILDSLKIDDLILTHKFVDGIWRNGSKFLHFYTLHDESHSIELIRFSIRITKLIDFIKIKREDYYILFLACYLHDIAMVIYPDTDSFSSDNSQTDLIYSKWKKAVRDLGDIETEPKSKIKRLILDYYEEVNDYFENKIRVNHHKLSASFIKEQRAFGFIEKAIRRVVADVSEAHNYEARNVYQIKSRAKHDIYDEKYLMIILRLADLLDMSKDRVSIDILKQDIKKMPQTSKYHWISHLAIDKCEISSEFPRFDFDEFDKKLINKEKKLSDLKPEEIIQIKITMNTKLFTQTPSKRCENVKCQIPNNVPKKNELSMEIEITNDNGTCTSKDCNFTCQWIMNKQNYLIKELIELKKYLDRNKNNIFKTRIQLLFNFTNSSNLSSEFMDVIKNEIGV